MRSPWTKAVFAAGFIAVLGVSGAGLPAAQRPGSDDEVEVVQIHPNFYLIAGAGGNIAV